MSESEGKKYKIVEAIERVHGKLHRIRTTQDASGKVVQQILNPLMVEFRVQDVCEIVVGAAVLAIPIAFTEEVWTLGEKLPWSNITAVMMVSICTVAMFVYFVFYKDHLRDYLSEFIIRTVACYAIALIVVTIILVLFQKCPWQSDPGIAIKRIVLVGFPACFSATVVDSLK